MLKKWKESSQIVNTINSNKLFAVNTYLWKTIYFSLGDREARTRNALLSTVEDKTGKVYDKYKNKGIETTFEMNPGNHFKDADLRLAKGIA